MQVPFQKMQVCVLVYISKLNEMLMYNIDLCAAMQLNFTSFRCNVRYNSSKIFPQT